MKDELIKLGFEETSEVRLVKKSERGRCWVYTSPEGYVLVWTLHIKHTFITGDNLAILKEDKFKKALEFYLELEAKANSEEGDVKCLKES